MELLNNPITAALMVMFVTLIAAGALEKLLEWWQRNK